MPTSARVLWPELIEEWKLSDDDAASINRREGQRCPQCGVPLRSAALAAAILRFVGWHGTFGAWASSEFGLSVLEHLADSLPARSECRRILVPGGAVCFTIPITSGRMSRRRDDLAPSFHGSESDPNYLVFTEYGADFWTQAFDSGFTSLSLGALQWPDAIALTAMP